MNYVQNRYLGRSGGDIGAVRVTTAVQPKCRPTYARQLPSLTNALRGQAPRKK